MHCGTYFLWCLNICRYIFINLAASKSLQASSVCIVFLKSLLPQQVEMVKKYDMDNMTVNDTVQS